MGVTDTTDRDLNAARRAADMYSTLPRSSIDLLMSRIYASHQIKLEQLIVIQITPFMSVSGS